MRTNAIGSSHQQAHDFTPFFKLQLASAVAQLDYGGRLDIDGLARGALVVYDTLPCRGCPTAPA